jgi:predicted AAA+ superfamily ATPase
MKIIHDMNALPRLVSGALADRLAVMPAVVVTGARQTGKSTLAEQLVPGERRYRTLDDFDVRDAARRACRSGGTGDVLAAPWWRVI